MVSDLTLFHTSVSIDLVLLLQRLSTLSPSWSHLHLKTNGLNLGISGLVHIISFDTVWCVLTAVDYSSKGWILFCIA